MTVSAEDELVELQRRKEDLMNRLEVIRRDRSTLEEGIRILKERMAVRELEERLRAEQNALSKLSFERQELEERLNQPGKLSVLEAIEKAKTEQKHKENTVEAEPKKQPETEETKQPEAEETKETEAEATEQSETEETKERETEETEQIRAMWKEHEETSESDKEPEEPEEHESKKKLKFF